jgi:hypothetical protein
MRMGIQHFIIKAMKAEIERLPYRNIMHVAI